MDDEPSPKSHVNTNYLPLPDSSNPPPQSTKPTWRTKLSKYWAFAVHLALIALVSTTCLFFIDGRTFNVNSRRPYYREVDGSLSNATSYAPLQSDITTAVSLAASVTRAASGWWATGYIWRCIFVAMERGGISAKGVSQAISSPLHLLCHSTRKSNMIIIYITLFATFAIDYFSAVLTGSFTWEAADMHIPGRIPLEISNATSVSYHNWSAFPVENLLSMASVSASIAWMLSDSDPLLNITETSTTSRRVIQMAQYISTNSTLAEVTMPYFAVDAFEWVQDPHQVLTDTQISLLSNQTKGNLYNPFTSAIHVIRATGALLPDVQWGEGPHWPQGPSQDPGMPISETRPFALLVGPININAGAECSHNFPIDPGFQISLFQGGDFCYGIANVSYRAGVFKCRNCRIISPNVVEGEAAPSSLIGNPFTSYALQLSPLIGPNLMSFTFARPSNPGIKYGTYRNLNIDLFSRAYQAAWAALPDLLSELSLEKSGNTTVHIALPTLRAKITHWRIYLWVALHLWVLALGLLFAYIQSHCDYPWVEDPTMAVFWLDTGAILSDPGKQRVSDPWQPGTLIREDEYGRLVFEHNEAGQRSVQVRKDSSSRQHRYSDSIPLRRRMRPSSFATPREEGRESVEALIGTSVLKTSPLDSTNPESSAE